MKFAVSPPQDYSLEPQLTLPGTDANTIRDSPMAIAIDTTAVLLRSKYPNCMGDCPSRDDDRAIQHQASARATIQHGC